MQTDRERERERAREREGERERERERDVCVRACFTRMHVYSMRACMRA